MPKEFIWPYYIWMYFNILKKLNSNLKKLNKLDGKKNNIKREKLYCEMFGEIAQIIPMKIINNKIIIKNNGILELLDGEEKYVKEGFEEMKFSMGEFLYYIKETRNNIEHSPHRLLLCSQIGTKNHSNIIFNYIKPGVNVTNIGPEDIVYCYCDNKVLELIINKLNNIFILLRKEIYNKIKKGKIDPHLREVYSKYRLE